MNKNNWREWISPVSAGLFAAVFMALVGAAVGLGVPYLMAAYPDS